MSKNNTTTSITVKENKVGIMRVGEVDYISLTGLAKYQKSSDPSFTIKNWLRRISTIDYIGLWEQVCNKNFNLVEFDQIKAEYGKNSFAMSPTQWIKRTGAIGIVSKGGRYSIGTYAHPDIAFEFASWLSPEFKLYLIIEFERLKKNEAYRERLEWRDNNPELAKNGNIRDYTDLLHLIILNNLENANALLIKDGLPQSERLIRLNEIAKSQMRLLLNNKSINEMKLLDEENGKNGIINL